MVRLAGRDCVDDCLCTLVCGASGSLQDDARLGAGSLCDIVSGGFDSGLAVKGGNMFGLELILFFTMLRVNQKPTPVYVPLPVCHTCKVQD